MKNRLYFAHPVNIYGTDLERKLIERITRQFPHWEIENPGLPVHEEGYQRYKREIGNGMEYFLKEVLPACQGGVVLRYRDGAWGAGVHKEAVALAGRGCPIWLARPNRGNFHLLSSAELAEARVLTIEETRARVRDSAGKILPY